MSHDGVWDGVARRVLQRAGMMLAGGWKSSLEDSEVRRITPSEKTANDDPWNAETRRHVEDCRESLPAELNLKPLVLGFDGFIDSVREAVDSREGSTSYRRMDRLGAFGDRITQSAASGSSCTIEWTNIGTRTGGHTAHLGRVFSTLGYDPVLVGTFGQPVQSEFEEEFGDRELLSLGQPTYTDAVEFSDGKLLLTDTGAQSTLDWDTVCEEVGLQTLAQHVDGASMLGIGYWAMIPSMETIWEGISVDLWPLLDDPPEFVLIDTADIRQISTDRLESGLSALNELNRTVPVTLSANRAEMTALAELFDGDVGDLSLISATQLVRDGIGLARVAGHSADKAVLATGDGTATVVVPRTDDPELTTSAGDHFNAGLALGQLLGLSPGGTLVLANAVAGQFVRTGTPPTYREIREFVEQYDKKFTDS